MRKQTVYPGIFTKDDFIAESPEILDKKIEALIQAMTFEEKNYKEVIDPPSDRTQITVVFSPAIPGRCRLAVQR